MTDRPAERLGPSVFIRPGGALRQVALAGALTEGLDGEDPASSDQGLLGPLDCARIGACGWHPRPVRGCGR